ncbi:MAG TPA: ABC transporter ATP-binding protein [bacterium]|nr:ABC transporter ATP-binding protein [bacterium]
MADLASPRVGEAAALVLLNVRKQYGDVTVLDNLSLTVAPGEFFTLLGPSGSGKTTTLMLWAGFVLPSAGRVVIGGRDVSTVPPYRRNLGMVFQHYALFPHLTVAQNIAFPLEMRRWRRPAIRARVAELLELVRLGGLAERLPRHLSGGQQQRVAVARALAASPPAILMDEPLGALDRKLREELQVELRRVHRATGATVAYVTHDQAEALILSDRVAVMRDGRIEQVEAPATLYEHPATRFVAEFLGDANFFAGRVVAHQPDAAVVETGDGMRLRIPPVGAVGGEVLVMVRPERLRLLNGGDDPPNVISGTLTDRAYNGLVVRYQVTTAARKEIVLSVPSFSAPPVEVGMPVRVGWAIEAGRVVAP